MFEFTEYDLPPTLGPSVVQMLPGKELRTQQVAVGAASLASAAFSAGAHLIVGSPTVDCRIAFGANPEARRVAPLTRLLKAGQEYYFWVAAGDKLAVIQA